MSGFKVIKNGRISSPYGVRVIAGKKQFHAGIDIVSDEAQPNVYAAYKCVINTVGLSSSFGNRVWVKNLEGLHKDEYTVYPHMDSINPTLKVGDVVEAGKVLGIMGNTGYILYKNQIVLNNDKHIPLPHGKHLHFEHRKNLALGETVDNCPNPEDQAENYR